MTKGMSKPQRWSEAVKSGLDALNALDDALTDLRDLYEEYEEWRDNMPDSLQDSPTYEKLDDLLDSADSWFDEIESAKDQAENNLIEAEEADLPRGFGRD